VGFREIHRSLLDTFFVAINRGIQVTAAESQVQIVIGFRELASALINSSWKALIASGRSLWYTTRVPNFDMLSGNSILLIAVRNPAIASSSFPL